MHVDIAAAASVEATPSHGLHGPPLSGHPWLGTADRFLGHLVEIPAALLVLAEIGVLLAGVVSRYIFHEPLVWSDELAGILFLWLAMLGAVVAFRRAEHMRMTAIVAMTGPRTRAFLETVALVAGLIFVSLVLHPAYEFAAEEIYVQTPALDLNNAWRAAALPIGLGLMLLVAVIRLFETADWRMTAGALGLGVAVAGGLAALQPWLAGLGNLNLLLFFVLGVGALVFSGVPIAFAFGLSTFAYITLTTNAPSMVVVGRMDEGMSHLILLAVPLFVFLGLLIEMTGMAKAMVGFLAS
ncbi:MAG: TRAP transporter small permease subunit, partial [Sphingomonadaceae bacterium]